MQLSSIAWYINRSLCTGTINGGSQSWASFLLIEFKIFPRDLSSSCLPSRTIEKGSNAACHRKARVSGKQVLLGRKWRSEETLKNFSEKNSRTRDAIIRLSPAQPHQHIHWCLGNARNKSRHGLEVKHAAKLSYNAPETKRSRTVQSKGF